MPKIKIRNSEKIKKLLALTGTGIFILLGLRYILFYNSKFILDIAMSIIAVSVFYMLYDRLHQDNISYLLMIITLLLHDLSLYGNNIFGIPFEHYMHFFGGFTIATITDRLFNEKLHKAKRFLLLIIFSLGIGAIVEITEWIGFKILGPGEGLFYFGAGDFDSWHNTIKDLIFNASGATLMGIRTLFRKK
jgi:uncharacterized membrane protein YjdF